MVALIQNDIEKIEPLNMLIKVGNISTTLLVDSESACSIINQSLPSEERSIAVHMHSGFATSQNHSSELSRTNQFALKAKYKLLYRVTFGYIHGRR